MSRPCAVLRRGIVSRYTRGCTRESPLGRMSRSSRSATVAPMDDPDMEEIASELPIIHRVFNRHYSARQLVYIDVAAVVLLAIICLYLLPPDLPKVHGAGWEIVAGIGYSIAALGTLFRRRFPLSSLLLVEGIAIVAECLRAPGPTPFYVMMVLYSVVAVSSRRRGAVVVTLVAVSVLASTLVGGGANRLVAASIGGLALVGVAWLAGENTRASRVYASRMAGRAAEKAAALDVERAEQVRRAVADERVEIARELHDVVAHAMSVIAVRSGVARMVIDTRPDQAREALAIIERTTRRSLQEMRLLVSVLRDDVDHPAELGPVPGMDDLDRLVAEVALAGVLVDVRIEGEPRKLPPAASLSGFRIVQEALTNVVRHAGPTTAHLAVRFRPEEVDIEVIDDGPNSPMPHDLGLTRKGAGHGLIGMRERAALFGGSLEAGPRGAGFRIRADLHTHELPDDEYQAQGAR
jgi:signal transduction histidine kinase